MNTEQSKLDQYEERFRLNRDTAYDSYKYAENHWDISGKLVDYYYMIYTWLKYEEAQDEYQRFLVEYYHAD